jgi:predicted ATPase/DNA-binding winged helix-turn-helix (wHTH) protein
VTADRPDPASPTTTLPGADGEVRFSDFVFDLRSHALLLHGEVVALGGPPRSLLARLLAEPGTVVGNTKLMEAAWPGGIRVEANLRVQITALRRALAQVPEGRNAILNIPGRGYSFVLPVRRRQEGPAIATTADDEAGRPPPLLVSLVGREREMALLAQRLEDRPLVTLAGTGGIGKTSLALAAAKAWAEGRPRRLRFLDLSSVTDAALLPMALAGAFGLGTPGITLAEEIDAALGQEETLLILDNADHLTQAVAPLARQLLDGCPTIRLLVTSREPLLMPGEWVLRLLPLAMPPVEEAARIEAVLAYPAASLFAQRAAARIGSFRPGDADAAVLARLCRQLDGLPLAINLAASRIDMFGIAGLAAGMADLLAAPGKARRGTPERHRALRATLDWSYDTLDPEDQRLLRRLSVFRHAFTQDAAKAVAGQEHPSEIGPGLMRLEAKSLITRRETAGLSSRPAWRLLETTRAYAAEKLAASGEAAAMRRRHALLMLDRVEEACRDIGKVSAALWRWAHADLPQELRPAIDWAFGETGDMALGLELVSRSDAIWLRLNATFEYRHHLEQALRRLSAAGRGESADAARLHMAAGLTIMHNTGEAPLMAEHLQHALEIGRASRDTGLRVSAITRLWQIMIMSGERTMARRLTAELTTLMPEDLPDDSLLSQARHRMEALDHYYRGDLPAARDHLDRVLRVRDRRLDTRPLGLVMDHNATAGTLEARMLWLEGAPEQAWTAARRALDAAMAAESALSQCYTLCQATCPIALWNGHPSATELTQQMMDIAQRHRMPYWLCWARCFHAIATTPPGQVPVLPQNEEMTSYHLEVMATLHPALAEPATIARAHSQQAGWCAPELLRAKAENLLRRAGHEPGVGRAAERILRDALSLAETQCMRGWSLRAATSLARLLARNGEAARGRALLAPILAGFGEGQDLPNQQAARALLLQADGDAGQDEMT